MGSSALLLGPAAANIIGVEFWVTTASVANEGAWLTD